MIKEKIRNIQGLLKKQHIDTLLIGNFGHQIHDDLLYYLLLTHLELGIMLIPQDGVPVLYAIPFEVEQLTAAYPEIQVKPLNKKLEVILKKYEGSVGYRPSALPIKQYDQFLPLLGGVRGGSSQHKYPSINNEPLPSPPLKWEGTFFPLTGEDKLMSIKLQEEKALLKKAAHITDIIFSNLVTHWNKFKTETDVATYIRKQCIEHDVEPSFSPIVASGKNAANPHHTPKAEALQQGFCVIDMGVRYEGYCSDMTRTIYVGKPSKKELSDYNAILHAQEQAISECTQGTKILDIAKNCRNNLGAKFEKHFTHSLGHGLGTQVHEWPPVSKKADTKLEESMCITIEPGVYIPNMWGIRIEDDVLISKKGPEILTTSPTHLQCV